MPGRHAILAAVLAGALSVGAAPGARAADGSPPNTASADPATNLAAYHALFGIGMLQGGRPGPSLTTGWTLHYRGAVPHAAFAYALDAQGRARWSFVSGRPSVEDARARALSGCTRGLAAAGLDPAGGAAACRVLAVDGTVEGRGGGPSFPPRGETIGPFRAAPLMFRYGPAAARGAVVWGHGYGGPARDLRATPLPGFLAVLNDAGWDVLRFDRDPAEDTIFRSQPLLVRGLAALREAGYRRVVLGGQSRGGWQALLAAAERPELVDAVIATAPAAHGSAEQPNNHAAALEDFRRVLAGLPEDGRVRLGVVLFEGDPFDPGPAERAAIMADLARRRAAPTLAIWPGAAGGREGAPAEIRGHAGAQDWRFTRYYAGCLLTLVQAPPAAVARGVRREPCGGG